MRCAGRLYADHPDCYRDVLSAALGNLAIDLRNLGLDTEAQQVDAEAADIAQ